MMIRTIGAALLILSLSTAAVARQPDAFDACAKEHDSAQRLACFDRETASRHATDQTSLPATPSKTATPSGTASASQVAPPSRAVTPSQEAPAPKRAPAAVPARSLDSDIGLDARQLRAARRERGETASPPPAPIVARVVRVIPREPYISAFELDNGQIWEESETSRLSFTPQDEVSIRHGALGSFFLKSAHGTSIRVHRVK